jgi:hypothetical protein
MRLVSACTVVLVALMLLLSVGPVVGQEPPAPAPAPIVHSNPPPSAAPVPARPPAKMWSTKAEVSYVSTSGNADTTTAKLGGETQYKPGPWTMVARGAFLTSTAVTAGRNQRVDGLLRASRTVSPRLELFGQMVYLENTFAGIGSSFYPLGGVAYALVDAPPHSWKGRLGLGYGQESRLRRPDLSFATADAETAYRWNMSKTAEFRQDAQQSCVVTGCVMCILHAWAPRRSRSKMRLTSGCDPPGDILASRSARSCFAPRGPKTPSPRGACSTPSGAALAPG